MSESRRADNNFDIIRFVAASFVIITHSYGLLVTGKEDWLSMATNGVESFTGLGLKTFFIISGFLITQSLLNSKSYIQYLWRRCLRIFPGLAVVLLLTTFVLGPCITDLTLNAYFSDSKTYSHLLTITLYKISLLLPGVFTNNLDGPIVNGSLWTLAYEFSLYILMMAALFVGLLSRKHILLGAWVLLFALRIYLGNRLSYYSYTSPFLLGLNIAEFYNFALLFGIGAVFLLFKHAIPLNWKGSVLLLTIFIVTCYINPVYAQMEGYIFLPYWIFYIAFIPGKTNGFAKYGDFSYGLYIYAYPIQQTIIHFTKGNISVLMLIVSSLLVTLPFAILSWHLIEKRALKLKRIDPADYLRSLFRTRNANT